MVQNLILNLKVGDYFTMDAGDCKILYYVDSGKNKTFNILRIGEIPIG